LQTYPNKCDTQPSTSVEAIREANQFLGESEQKLEQFIDLLICMLQYYPKNRLSAEQLLAHPFFTSSLLSDTCFQLLTTCLRPLLMEVSNNEGQNVLSLNLEKTNHACLHVPNTPPFTLSFFDTMNGREYSYPLMLIDGGYVTIDTRSTPPIILQDTTPYAMTYLT